MLGSHHHITGSNRSRAGQILRSRSVYIRGAGQYAGNSPSNRPQNRGADQGAGMGLELSLTIWGQHQLIEELRIEELRVRSSSLDSC
jgi:hypothetical protein